MIKIYGGLARKLNKLYPMVNPKAIPCKVNSAGEAIRALESQFKGFKSLIKKRGHYKVVRGEDIMDNSKSLNEKEISMKFSETTWHIMPIASGAGGNMSFLQIVLGAALIVAGIVLWSTPWGIPLVMTGAGILLGGIIQMLSPVPSLPKSEREESPSYLFNGGLNVEDAGVTVPLCYGEAFVGSVVTSFGILVEKY